MLKSIFDVDTDIKLYNGNSLDVLKRMKDNSIDSIVTDPPYGLSQHTEQDIIDALTAWLAGKEYETNKKGFMANTWDSFVPGPEIWKECYRVLKPGGHMLVFAGTRTQDLMGIALRLSGFEIRDTIMWAYGSGFPHSHNIGKAIDRIQGNERKKIPATGNLHKNKNMNDDNWTKIGMENPLMDDNNPISLEAKRWNGWGTALKPAYEPILLVRKPIEEKNVALNVLKYGTGGINIDECRVETEDDLERVQGNNKDTSTPNAPNNGWKSLAQDKGRWPANIILQKDTEEVEDCFPDTTPSKKSSRGVGFTDSNIYGSGDLNYDTIRAFDDSGSASRYFNKFDYGEEDLDLIRILYHSKANKKDRNEGLEKLEAKQYSHDGRNTPIENPYQRNNSSAQNFHPTVKPTELMRHLCRLITPKGGTIYDPFMGSGSTGKAAKLEGFNFIGSELEYDYCVISAYRVGLDESDIENVSL